MDYTILLVEDDKKLREIMTDYLTQNLFVILPASDGAQALSLFHEHMDKIDLVLLDGMLPMLDGLEVLRAIRTESTVPVIIGLWSIMQSKNESSPTGVPGTRRNVGRNGTFLKNL